VIVLVSGGGACSPRSADVVERPQSKEHDAYALLQKAGGCVVGRDMSGLYSDLIISGQEVRIRFNDEDDLRTFEQSAKRAGVPVTQDDRIRFIQKAAIGLSLLMLLVSVFAAYAA